eukprot:8220717-Ditylum_brightwellii.AAC.1
MPPPEQLDNDDDDSTYVPDEEAESDDKTETDERSLPSIPSMGKASICHGIADFEPLTNITTTTGNVTGEADNIAPSNSVSASIAGVSRAEEEEEG